MSSIIKISHLTKVYHGGFRALDDVNLEIKKGEIFALLGPNGAGKTTLIGSVCGLINPTAGSITVNDLNIVKDYRKTRSMIGLVPQEITTDSFESVWDTVSFSRGLFGLSKNPAYIEKILKALSLWEKRKNKIMTLSGGMKRRVMIAKALSHEPKILFLDEPTAGVDVELRKDMWNQVSALRDSGVTIILTTHYIDEAEQMADRIGVINKGKLMLVEEKDQLMKKLGTKELSLELKEPVVDLPEDMKSDQIKILKDGNQLVYTYDASLDNNGIPELLDQLKKNGIAYRDLNTKQSSLEEIFVKLVNEK